MYRVGGRAAFLALSFHHLILDGTSQQIIMAHLTNILAAQRRGEAARAPLNYGSNIGRSAIARHVHALKAPAMPRVPARVCELRLPCELVDTQEVGAWSLWHISEQTVLAARRCAQKMGVTLNAFVVGTLATCLFQASKQQHFAVGQTSLGRRPEELHVVGCYTTIVPLVFDFSRDPSQQDTCEHVQRETQRVLYDDCTVHNDPQARNLTSCYELTDMRPIPRPAEQKRQPTPNLLAGLFFAVGQHPEGWAAMVVYDAAKYDADYLERLMDTWIDLWNGR
jgi:hypothetical protein